MFQLSLYLILDIIVVFFRPIFIYIILVGIVWQIVIGDVALIYLWIVYCVRIILSLVMPVFICSDLYIFWVFTAE